MLPDNLMTMCKELETVFLKINNITHLCQIPFHKSTTNFFSLVRMPVFFEMQNRCTIYSVLVFYHFFQLTHTPYDVFSESIFLKMRTCIPKSI